MRLPLGTEIQTGAILFDMDGTLVDSTVAIERVWRRWADRRGLDPEKILSVVHGVRIAETVRSYAPSGTDIDADVASLMEEERHEADGIVAVPGAVEFVRSLPRDRYAVVTSADRRLTEIRMGLAGVPMPDVLVAAEDVSVGKPDPEGYRRAAELLGEKAHNAIVFEDSLPGIKAGRDAGFRVIAVTATGHGALAPSDTSIPDFTSLTMAGFAENGEIILRVVG